MEIKDCLLKDKVKLEAKLNKIKRIQDTGERHKALDKFKSHLAHAQAIYQSKLEKTHSFDYPDLPIVRAKEEIIEAIKNHQVVIVAGETGSGKSTQLSKFCLELGRGISGWIGHTQPRRLAARAVADRVCEEMNESLGDTVGYKVRFNEVVKPHTKIKLMTDGILVNELSVDKYLMAYDTLIIDEAHERSLNVDLILGLIKRLLTKRKDLKVVVTSATINLKAFSDFFQGAPVIEVPGKVYPVEIEHLTREPGEDMFTHLLSAVDIAFNKTKRDILVFLSGEGEIHAAKKYISQRFYKSLDICPLYARLSLQQQRKVFEPSRQRRIILATNVAETSLTVPNIGCVIDTGFARISRYSYKSKIQRLPIEPISQASIHQRTGRAGRLSEGYCLRLFSQEDYLSRDKYTQPEIQRTNLSSVLLFMAYLRLGDIDTFPWLDAPDYTYVRDGLKSLERLQALKDSRLTKAGHQMARLPLEPKLAKILIEASAHHCLSEALVIVSGLCIQDPREYPKEHLQHANQTHAEYADEKSSFLTYIHLWEHLKELKQEFSSSQFRKHCQSHFINFMRYLEWQDIFKQLKRNCEQLQLQFNSKPATYEQIHKALISGLFEGVGTWMEEAQVYLGPRGVKFHLRKNELKSKPKWVVAFALLETQKVYAQVVAKIEPHWVESVAQHLCKVKTGELFWDDRTGFIKAYEKVSFFGLPLVEKRRASIKDGHESVAREVFMQQALVEHKLKKTLPWLSQIQAVIHKLKGYEDRIRRPSGVYDEKALYDFYDKTLPAHIYSVKSFEKWLDGMGATAPQLKATDISFVQDLNDIELNYPSFYSIESVQLNLHYIFDPLSDEDGVTLEIPIKWLTLLQRHDFSWGLPGFLPDKLDWYLSKINKSFRQQLPSVKECLSVLPSKMDSNIPFPEAFKNAIRDLYQIQIPHQVIESIREPDYLKIRFKIIEDENSLLVTRDFNEVLDQFSTQFKSQHQANVKHSHCTHWSFGQIPLKENIKMHGQMVLMYPALVDMGDSVSLEYFQEPLVASAKHHDGLTRLFMLVDTKLVTFLKKNLNHRDWIKKNSPGLIDYPQLMEDIIYQGFYETFVHEQEAILDEHSFNKRFTDKKTAVTSVTQSYATLVYSVLKTLSDIQNQYRKVKREKQSSFPENVQDIHTQLKLLCQGRFVKVTPKEWLLRYPFYLKAISIRMNKLLDNPMQDSKLLKQIRFFCDGYQKHCQGREDSQCEQYRWALEEYRISLFAQPMKSKMQLSDKKMKLWLKALI